MFLLLGLGGAIGLGSFIVAATGVALLSVILFNVEDSQKTSGLSLQVRSASRIPAESAKNERYAA
jgi:hypothetical protein